MYCIVSLLLYTVIPAHMMLLPVIYVMITSNEIVKLDWLRSGICRQSHTD